MSNRWAGVFAAICLVAIGSARIVSTYKIFNFTIDEPAHIAAGSQWLDAGLYRFDMEHPPLERIVAALGVRFAGNRWDGNPNMWYAGFRLLGGGKGERGLVFGRAAVLPFFWIACAVVFMWGRRLGGSSAGVMSLVLFTSVSPILAHAGLITTDMAGTAFAGAMFLAALCWAEKPDLRRTVVMGAMTGLAALSKFSALPFLASSLGLAYVGHLAWHRPGLRQALQQVTARLPSAGMALLIAALIVWSGYRFSFGRTDLFPFPVPAPEWFSGIAVVWKHNLEGHGSYLLGRKSMHGFWYYYPVAFAVKTPVAMLLLLAASGVMAVRKRYPLGIPVLFSLGIVCFALFSHINIGIRHVLPVYIGACVAAGVGCAAMLRDRPPKWAAAAIYFLLVSHVASSAWKHPDYLSYTNELFWNHPERVLADSDVDWGQDMKRLNQRMEELGVHSLFFRPFNGGYLLNDRPFPTIMPVPVGDKPPIGWTAVSVTVWKLDSGPRWLDYTQPTEKIGQSILLFHRE